MLTRYLHDSLHEPVTVVLESATTAGAFHTSFTPLDAIVLLTDVVETTYDGAEAELCHRSTTGTEAVFAVLLTAAGSENPHEC